MFPGSCFLAGCLGLTGNRNPTPPAQQTFIQDTPTPQALVAYLNRRTAAIQSLESRELDMDVKAGKSEIGLHGSLFCQKPKNFRLKAKGPVLGTDVADFGSNDQEFWYWISEDRPPYLYHCAYADLERGNVTLPFPLKPDWVLEVLGMSAPDPVTPEQDQARGRSLAVSKYGKDRYIALTERTTAPQGQPVTKVTVFNNLNASGSTPQVVGHLLYDARGQLICQATVVSVHHDAASQAVVPHKVRLEWPAQQLALTLTLGEVAVNNPKTDAASNPKLFTRPALRDVRTFDLARGMPDGASPLSIQRAGALR